MELIHQFIDLFLHLDRHLADIMQEYGTLTYVILFTIIFVETGLVVMPFLPGDSLLFATGALAASTGKLDLAILLPLLIGAALLGDNVNYFIGKTLGSKVFQRDYRFLKKAYLLRTQEFYEKHGGKTIVIARFIPIVRTFAPFVAGVGTMRYSYFIGYCIVGALAWVSSFLIIGYAFGNQPFVKQNFTPVVLGIVFLSVAIPPFTQLLKNRFGKPKENV